MDNFKEGTKLLSYPEFMEKLWHCKNPCKGCLESVCQYIDDYLPWHITDYKSLGVPEKLLKEYKDTNANFEYKL